MCWFFTVIRMGERNYIVPEESLLFEPVKDAYGLRLALVFGNEFKGGQCPFYLTGNCNHCVIGAGEGAQFTSEMNEGRLEFFRNYYKSILSHVNHLVIYNSGSTLNEKEMSRETLGKILDYAASLEGCMVISLDSRELFITENNVGFVLKKIREDQKIKIILGIETQNDEIRTQNLNKAMTKKGIELAFRTVGNYNDRAGITLNIIFQPPELKGKSAIMDAAKTLKYGLELSEKYNVCTDFNFHPFYPTEKSAVKFPNHKRADLNDAKKALMLMKEEIDKRKSNSKIFIGCHDEGHDIEHGKRAEELERNKSAFDRFNACQDISCLKK